ncbi:MAG TPA: hypothetical protein VH105_02135 [Burkholderiales bacterium]|jgi:hypothetical protein|nr:hypothetical protein [Burkholderiales bacterium]
MKNNPSTEQKELMAEFDLARQAFNTSHAQLRRNLLAAGKGKKPVSVLKRSLKQHLTAAACLLAMGRATSEFRRQHPA